jgi:hypothetical protein
MFRALLVHPQEVLHKRHLVYCVRVLCQMAAPRVQPSDITRKQFPSAVCAGPPGDGQVMLETRRDP